MTKGRRVIVCGGRDFADTKLLDSVLDRMHEFIPFALVIHGDYRGADHLADCWATSRKILVERFPADWHRHGKKAGPLRNARMLAEGRPDCVVAFSGGDGTANMIVQAVAAYVPVLDVRERRSLG